jgi:hypothetical protein
MAKPFVIGRQGNLGGRPFVARSRPPSRATLHSLSHRSSPSLTDEAYDRVRGACNGHSEEDQRGSGKDRHKHEEKTQKDEERSRGWTTRPADSTQDAGAPPGIGLARAIDSLMRSSIVKWPCVAGDPFSAAVVLGKQTGEWFGSPGLAWWHRRKRVPPGMVAGVPQGAVPADYLPRIFLPMFPLVSTIPQLGPDAFQLPVVQPHPAALATHINAHRIALSPVETIAAAWTPKETRRT